MDNIAFGKILKEMRLKRNMSREELAKKIGISAKAISQIETGKKSTSLKVLVEICNALEVSAECFLLKDLKPELKNLKSDYEELFCNILELPEGEIRRFSDYIKLTLERYQDYK